MNEYLCKVLKSVPGVVICHYYYYRQLSLEKRVSLIRQKKT